MVLLSLFSLFASVVFAAGEADVKSKPMHIEYGSSSWNNDSKVIDNAFMIVKDRNTGKTVQIQLEETAPDSSQFEGQFHVNLGDKPLEPQVYIPPQELRQSDRDWKKINQLIQSNKLESKPLITKSNDNGQMVLDVYDTPAQAQAAQEAWNDQQRLKAEAERQRLLKQVPDQEKMKKVADAEHQAALNKLAMDAANRAAERVRLEQIERQKAMEREKAARAASDKERAERKLRAQQLHEEAMVAYRAGKFRSAEARFKQAIELDPETKLYLFRYGVTLYRLNKFNEAIVNLKLADVPADLELERQYFLGLTYYRLNELSNAREAFKLASGSKDPIIGPSSMFYLGVVQFAQDDLDRAKSSFETVIDTSQDPKMDRQAEEYIDRIAQAMMFKKMREKRWTLTGIVGGYYDSNVTYSPDPDVSASATEVKDFRLNTVADISYRAIYNAVHELTPKVSANLTNSLKDEAAVADPFIYDFAAPYSFKTAIKGRGYVLGVKPTYEMLYMDGNSTGTKTNVLNSILVDFDNTLVMRANWLSIYTLQVRKDTYDLTSSVGDDDFDAMKYTLKTSQIFYRDKARKEALTANLGVISNQAEGKNKQYLRVDFGATYTRPMKWGYAWNLGLQAYQASYSESVPSRTDVNMALTAGIEKPIREWVTWSLTGVYTKNDSTQEDTYEYSRYTITTQAIFNTNL